VIFKKFKAFPYLLEYYETSLELCTSIDDYKCSFDMVCVCNDKNKRFDQLTKKCGNKKYLDFYILDENSLNYVLQIVNYDCFQYVASSPNEKLSWSDAEDRCKSLGGRLASPRDDTHFQRLNQLVMDMVPESGNEVLFWIGLKTDFVPKNWTWLNGNYMKSTHDWWSTGEPNNAGSGSSTLIEGCGLIRSAIYEIDDRSCSDNNQFICEFGNLS
jgi:hypothetical protein